MCGLDATLEVVADDWDDAPAGFTLKRTCSGSCGKTYTQLSPQQMNSLAGILTRGWSPDDSAFLRRRTSPPEESASDCSESA